ncbi:RICIN domain-containing protein [Streptacidiphilus anmyonensis]|uniref:RICIN domain-containing protein n=1 Tax=Streptacidiphilus anmyonensis TaxID=405782 RepID=UPI000693366A|nr:RICIN domain-containing protein [Streptacidiphilus anmyonensis]
MDPRIPRIRGGFARLPVAALAAVLLALTAPTGARAATASANLLLNGDAETSQCSPGGWEETTVPGWQIASGDPVINCYGVPTGASATTPGPSARGGAYFQGGARGASRLSQTTDLSSAGGAVDSGTVHATLSGWLGGVGSDGDAATVTITYRDASGSSLGTASIGPVSATDRADTTEFLQRSSTTTVPAGTRSVVTTVDFSLTSGTNSEAMADDLSLTLDASVTVPTLAVPASTVPRFDHVFTVMLENNNYSATSNTADNGTGIIGNTSAPYINGTLLPMGSLLTNYHAGTHNSDPNYEQIAFGNSYGRSSQSGNANCITSPSCTATNNGLGDNLDAAGRSWKQYTQSQTSNCQTADSGEYAADDVPFYYAARMKNDNAYCQAHWQPLSQLLGTDLASTATTPDFVWFDPDSCDDMEDCGIAAGDTWLSQTLPTLFASPAWTQQKSLLVLTFDEDGSGSYAGFGTGQTNQVMTLVIGSQGTVKAGYLDANRYDHYSTARVFEGALGLTATMTDNDKWATPYNEVFTAGSAPADDFSIADTTFAAPVNQGASAGAAVATAVTSGAAEAVTLAASGLPGGVTATFDPATVTAGGTSTMTLHAASSAALGTVTATVTGTSGSTTHSVPFTVTVGVPGSGGGLVSGGTYEIIQGGKAVDDPGSSTTAGTQLIVWGLHGGTNQRWTFTQNGDGSFQMKNAVSGLCADDSGASSAAGSKIVQWTCTGNNNQRWTVVPSGSGYALVDRASGLALTAGGATDGSPLTQQPDTGSALQTWAFTRVG